jgi:hypothetical protein
MKKFKEKNLSEIDYFSIKNFNSQSVTNDLTTNQRLLLHLHILVLFNNEMSYFQINKKVIKQM